MEYYKPIRSTNGRRKQETFQVWGKISYSCLFQTIQGQTLKDLGWSEKCLRSNGGLCCYVFSPFYSGNFRALRLMGPGEFGDPLWTNAEASFTLKATGAMVGSGLADLRAWVFGTSARLNS